MKKKTYKILGVGLVVMLVASLLAFAVPVSADEFAPTANTWTSYTRPVQGALGGWFFDPDIHQVGPIARAIDDDLYAYVAIGNFNLPDTGDVLGITASAGARGIVTVLSGSYTFTAGGGGTINVIWAGAPIFGWTSYEWLADDDGSTFTLTATGSNVMGLLARQNGATATFAVAEAGGNACTLVRPAGTIYMSNDGRSWTTSRAPGAYSGGPVIDMVCSELYEDVLYVTDGNYVYKSEDGGNNFSIIAQENLEFHLEGDCGIPITDLPITCIDVGYNGAEEPIVFIGTRCVNHVYDVAHPLAGDDIVGSVYWIAEDSFPAEWHDLQLFCYGCCDPTDGENDRDGCFDVYAVGCDPNFADTNKTYALITTDDDACGLGGGGPSTRVVSTIGTTCSWDFVSELYYDCDEDNPFEIIHASRFAFPTDFEDTHTMFIGVTAWTWSPTTNTPGGDVYRVVDTTPDTAVAIDLNVQGFTTGCIGLRHANICSLDMTGSTDDGSLIAGAFDDYDQDPTNVYYSNDGGWTWAASKKDPTGVDRTYVLWYMGSAVAGTRWCDCAFSMSCGDEVGEYFNQISLINTCIQEVIDLSHAPGYVDGATTMYMLTFCWDACLRYGSQYSTSLFRWDGTYWERVFSNFTYENPSGDALMDWVEVSPDFNTTSCLYLASMDFQMYRSIDAGCSWSALSYPCEPRPDITAWIVVDEETVLAAGTPDGGGPITVYKTTRHGTRPWDAFPIMDACYRGVDFDLSPNIANDGQVLLGDGCGQVFISEDVGSSWAQVFNASVVPCNVLGYADTYVQFDPSYGTGSPDPAGENMIYAAAGHIIARCNVNPDAMWNAQCWETINDDVCAASGIDAQGDTALYVSDAGYRGEPGSRIVTIDGSIAMQCLGCLFCGVGDLGGVFSPWGGATVYEIEGDFEDGELVEIISYNLECACSSDWDGYGPFYGYYCYCSVWGEIGLRGISSGAIGEAYIEGAYYAENPFEYYFESCGGATSIISSHLVATVVGAPDISDCPAGVWRTLNPLDFIPPGVPFAAIIEFEKLTTGLKSDSYLVHDYFTYWTDDLWLTTKGASNVLWCLDYNYPTYVWVWDDPLANRVTLESPACGATLPAPTGVTLEWAALDGATEYEIELYQYCPQCPEERLAIPVPNSKDTCAIVSGLAAGTKHYWRVRVAEGEPFLSKWSELCTFTTALLPIANLCSPPCGAEGVILTTNFSWDEVPGAASYELEIVAAGADGTADFTGAPTYTTGVNALASIPGLNYSTVYYWRVRPVSAGVPGAWSVCIFTTMDEPVAPVPPADVILVPPAEEVITPAWIWVLIGIGAALTIAVIILIVTTRRVP